MPIELLQGRVAPLQQQLTCYLITLALGDDFENSADKQCVWNG